ncbi:hypothetical protein [Bradyrhizobium sp. AZCC 1620]
MDGLSEACENILTRRRQISGIVASSRNSLNAAPPSSRLSGAIAGKTCTNVHDLDQELLILLGFPTEPAAGPDALVAGKLSRAS